MNDILESPPSDSRVSKGMLALTVVAVAALLGGGWYLYDRAEVSRAIGGYSLQVHVASERPIRAVKCVASFSRNEAEIVRNERDEWDISPAAGKADPFTGSPVEVRIDNWTDFTRSGRLIDGEQQEWLVVIATFEGNDRTAKLVRVPDMAKSREVHVEFP